MNEREKTLDFIKTMVAEKPFHAAMLIPPVRDSKTFNDFKKFCDFQKLAFGQTAMGDDEKKFLAKELDEMVEFASSMKWEHLKEAAEIHFETCLDYLATKIDTAKMGQMIQEYTPQGNSDLH